MSAFCDLHIHSCLSPCADDDMTPWNLVGMAKVLGLDVIALTDHNSARNVPEAIAAGNAYGVAVLPGMEITTKEEVHMLAYFPDIGSAIAADGEIYDRLMNIPNQPELFGNQILIGKDDEPCGTLKKLLPNAIDLGCDEVREMIYKYGGITVPAHINRGSNGMIGALGLMPFLPDWPVVEVYSPLPCPDYATAGRFQLHSSDAHHLDAIQEPCFQLDVDPTASAVFELIKSKM